MRPSGVNANANANAGDEATRTLIGLGVLAGPFYLAVSLAQVAVRDGFDLSRHALSHLANGPGGWVQTVNFALSGLMVIGAAVGMARRLGSTSRAMGWFLGAFGMSMLAAAVFPADPVDGFPVGTPLGAPTTISTTGLVHFIAGALGFVCLAVSCFVAARAMKRRSVPSLSRFSFFAGLAIVLGFFGGPTLPIASAMVAGIWFAVVVGWVWLIAMALHLRRAAPA